MDGIGGVGYAAVFGATLVLSLVLTPLALRVALRRQILDHPSAIKGQASAVPYLGGAAIVVSFAAAVLIAAFVGPPRTGVAELSIIIGIGVLLALMGLADDLRGLSPWLRLAIEIGAGLAVWATPAGADVFGNDVLDLVVSVMWVVGVTNAMNLLDNMDGLSAGVAALAAGFLFAMAADRGQFLVATLSLALAGCALGFLRSNFHPARIYMGDAGSLFLGFMLAVLTLKLDLTPAPQSISLLVPPMLLGIPIFDTALVTINRLRHGRSPLSGGRDHASHRLVFVGLAVPVSVTVIYVAAASLGVLALVVSRIDQTSAFVVAGWLVLLGALFGALLSRVPVYETSTRRRMMLREVSRHEGHGEPPPLSAAGGP